jgi:hypothetical protein
MLTRVKFLGSDALRAGASRGRATAAAGVRVPERARLAARAGDRTRVWLVATAAAAGGSPAREIEFLSVDDGWATARATSARATLIAVDRRGAPPEASAVRIRRIAHGPSM